MKQRKQAGFTLTELLVAITIAGILMAIAVPSYRDATLSSRLAALSNGLVASARLARSEAFKRNQTVSLCVSTDGANCTGGKLWHTGWIVAAGSTVLLTQGPAPSGFRISSGKAMLTFQPSGVGSTTDTFTVCRATPTVGARKNEISLDSTGRTYLAKLAASSCP